MNVAILCYTVAPVIVSSVEQQTVQRCDSCGRQWERNDERQRDAGAYAHATRGKGGQ